MDLEEKLLQKADPRVNKAAELAKMHSASHLPCQWGRGTEQEDAGS